LKPKAITATCGTDNSLLTAFAVVIAIVHKMDSPELFFRRPLQMKGFRTVGGDAAPPRPAATGA